MTYSSYLVNSEARCDRCGEPAVVQILADAADRETGDLDGATLCEACDEQEVPPVIAAQEDRFFQFAVDLTRALADRLKGARHD